MANTVSFFEGSFAVGVTDRPGTTNIVVDEVPGGFRLFNDDGSTIVGLGLLSDEGGINILIGDPDTTGNILEVDNADLNLIAGKDRLEVLGSGKKIEASLSGGDRLIFDGRGAKSDFDTTTSESRTVVRFRGNDISGNVSRGNEFNLGSTKDKLVFGGTVRNSVINDQGGKDLYRFRGNVTNTEINLGADSQARIELSRNGIVDGLRITGADQDDVLFIGSSEYRYQGDQTWASIEDPRDTRQF